jgi:all-trans-retinol 13,14-reductase
MLLYLIFKWLSYLSPIILYFYFKLEQNSYPKGYTTKKRVYGYIKSNNIRNGFTKRKIPQNIDTIVIGSGISGLSTAALLSKVGQRVLVLEQHYIAGGSTHAFEDKGFEFDTGIHYIGNIHKRKKIFDVITDEPLNWDMMGNLQNGWVYDEIVIGDRHYYLRAGEIAFLKEVKKYWPKEVENVKKAL